MKTTDWIVTTADLQADPAIILKHAKERPLIVTEAGRPSAYVLSVEFFDAMVERLTELEENELAINIAQAEEQFASGQFVSLQDAVSVLEAKWQHDEATS